MHGWNTYCSLVCYASRVGNRFGVVLRGCSRLFCWAACPDIIAVWRVWFCKCASPLLCRALLKVCDRFGTPGQALLEAYKPKQYMELVNGRSVAEAGCEPILHMRDFQRSKALSEALMTDIEQRGKADANS